MSLLKSITKKRSFQTLCFMALLSGQKVFAAPASTGMPWESVLSKVQNSLAGPVARSMIIIALIAAGIGLIMGEGGAMSKKMITICAGGAIIAAAVSWGPGFFDFAGGMMMA